MGHAVAYRLSALSFDRRGRLFYLPDAVLLVGADGRFERVGPAASIRPGAGARKADLRGSLAVPGLIDAHCHLSQYPAVASDGLELLPWLKRHIFPLERGFVGPKTRGLARRFFRDLAAHGTTTACVYTSIWKDSTGVCFEEAQASGLRVVMGKVMMDRGSYDTRFSAARRGGRAEVSLRESEELCRRWNGVDGGRIRYAFTPRFALSCSMELMRKTALAARRLGAYVQTHLAENHDELDAVRKAFPRSAGYAGVYAEAGLLGPRTILAHSIWLKEAEYRMLRSSGSAVAHCPASNAFLGSGIMDAGRMSRNGVPLALGSDVAGGPTLSLFEAMRQAVYGQRLARAHRLFDPPPRPSPAWAFHMATAGGARALGLEDRIGRLEGGLDADFVVIDPKTYDAGFPPEAAAGEIVSRLVYRAGRESVRAAFVRGRNVWPKP